MDNTKPNILTTNWHVPYVYNLAKLTQYNWYVVSWRNKMAGRDWDQRYRIIPDNVQHIAIDSPEYIKLLKGIELNLIIAHNFLDIELLKEFKVPKIMIFHNSFQTECRQYPFEQWKQIREQMKQKLQENQVIPVFISEMKRNSFEMNGRVILPGIDTEKEFPHIYNGIDPVILRICSNFKSRDFMNGYVESENLCENIPNILLGEGNNPQEYKDNTKCGMSQSIEQLKSIYQNCRMFLNTNIEKFEDCYNLSSLEAGAIGMPIITYSQAERSSIWQDGREGYISSNLDYLKMKIKELLQDRQQAIQLGNNARKLIEQNYNINRWLSEWNDMIIYSSTNIKQNQIKFK